MGKIFKLAVIREEGSVKDNGCPFGLPILDGCKCAGTLTDQMTPIIIADTGASDQTSDHKYRKHILTNEQINSIKESNNRVLMFSETPDDGYGQKIVCKYANYIFDEANKVECSYGENGGGKGVFNPKSPSSFPQYMGLGFYSIPLGFYNQNLSYPEGGYNTEYPYYASASSHVNTNNEPIKDENQTDIVKTNYQK